MEVRKTDEYERWIRSVKDVRGVVAITRQVDRISSYGDYVGDWKRIGDLVEVRIKGKGPGYRLYLSIEGSSILLLLIGGDKSRQSDDIKKAHALLTSWRDENEDV